MSLSNDFNILAAGIELAGGLLIVGYVLYAYHYLLTHIRRDEAAVDTSRSIVAEGAIVGLSFKLAATLLKTILLHTLPQILVFSVILALRIMLKRFFTWQQQHVQAEAQRLQAG